MIQKIREFFSDLTFEEEGHRYFIGGEPVDRSVSFFLKHFSQPFNEDEMAGVVAYKRGCTKEEVIQEWRDIAKEACELGTQVHLYGENYIQGKKAEPTNEMEYAVASFIEFLPDFIELVGAEIQMYHKVYKFAGTCDLLFFNRKTGKYIIMDYKTNKDLFKNFNEMLRYPFSDLIDCPKSKYEIQLSMYQILLQQVDPSIEVESRTLIWLRRDGTYEFHHCDDHTEKLNKWLKVYYDSK